VRRMLLVSVVLVLALSGVAQAEPSAMKLKVENFGRISVGERVTVTLVATNRSDVPLFLTAWSMSALNANSGWRIDEQTSGSCFAGLAPHQLGAGETCTLVRSFTPADPGQFRARICLSADVSYCTEFRGNVG
jgi:hypothetical protein